MNYDSMNSQKMEGYKGSPLKQNNFGQGAPGQAVIQDIEIYRVVKLKN